MEYTEEHELLSESVIRYRLFQDKDSLTNAQVFDLWETKKTFVLFYASLLRSVPFTVFRWETPGLTAGLADEGFEFVIVYAPEIDVPASQREFAEYFKTSSSVVTFPNLGNDALLVVPVPESTKDSFSHLAQFTRSASDEENVALWRQVGVTMKDRLSDKPVWLNTAGGGVPWLHVRLDDRPKYYRHAPYKSCFTG
ncbi:MAG: hypothetical protein AAF438_19050 [Pseudomonadota bacterium]